MSTQNDFVAGLDLSSLSSVTQAQIMQAINGMSPLSNIAGIVIQATAPDVTNNPRFKRYIWLDSSGGSHPVANYYDQSEAAGANNSANWASITVPAGSITDTQISAAAGIQVTKLDIGTARYVVRTDAAASAVEYVAPSGIFQANELPVADLVAAGSNGYLKTVSGVAAWVTDATERAAIQNAIVNLAVTQLAAGANNTILGVNSSGTIVFDTVANLIANNAISLAKLAQGGASTGDLLYWDGSNWVKFTPSLNLRNGATISTVGVSIAASVNVLDKNGATSRVAHGLGGTPRLLYAVLKNISGGVATGTSHPAGAEVPFSCFHYNSGNDPEFFAPYADSTYVGISSDDDPTSGAVNIKVIPYGGGAPGYVNITKTEWEPRIYAWL